MTRKSSPGGVPGVDTAAYYRERAEAGVGLLVTEGTTIWNTIDAFSDGAWIAQAVGFDAVEVHAAHGYLIDQFHWSRTNRRTDTWGGSLAARSRFGAEIIRAIRQRVGADFPIILRFSQFKIDDYAARLASTPSELEAFLLPYVEAGVNVFHASTRRHWELEFEGSQLSLSAWTRKITGKPTITVGSVGLDHQATPAELARELQLLENRLIAGEFDLVAVGRALLRDARWYQRAVAAIAIAAREDSRNGG